MKTMLFAMFLIVAGLVAFYAGGEMIFIRAIGLGFAVTGVIMLIVSMIDKEG